MLIAVQGDFRILIEHLLSLLMGAESAARYYGTRIIVEFQTSIIQASHCVFPSRSLLVWSREVAKSAVLALNPRP